MTARPEHASFLWLLQIATLIAGAVLVWRMGRADGTPALGAEGDGNASMHKVGSADRSAPVPAGPSSEPLTPLVQRLKATVNRFDTRYRRHVEDGTERTARDTRSLKLLYDVAASINVSRDLDDLLARSIRVLKEVVGAHAASVRLVEGDDHLRMVATLGSDEELIELKQKYTKSVHTIDTGEHGGLEEVAFFKHLGLISVPLPYRDRTHGVIDLYLDEHEILENPDLKELLTSVGRHLGMAIERHGLDHERERLSRMEERTRMAHELHDSLAQTLASLRFQVRVLDETLHQQDEPAIWQEMERVENCLDEAHIELRELISRFRAPIDQVDLVSAVEKVITRFKQKTGIPTFLQNEWTSEELPREIQRQVIRIVQEALANARKHSGARAIRVMLRSSADNEHRVLIEDDGVGIMKDKEPGRAGEHIGLTVMRERAHYLGGELKVESEANEGTRVLLIFRYPPATGEMSTKTAIS